VGRTSIKKVKQRAKKHGLCLGISYRAAGGAHRCGQGALIPMSRPPIHAALAAVAAVALLAGCSSSSKTKMCPTAGILVPTASLTTFNPTMHDDPAGIVYAISVDSVKTDCDFDPDNGTTDSSLEITFKATRPPSTDESSYKAPYYVAVAQEGRILTKHQFWVNFTFPAGAPAATFTDTVASTFITLMNGKKPYDYEILVGMQLTHDQLDYNNKSGHYAP
jgi:hypothetical protein